MREPPPGVSPTAVADAVAAGWATGPGTATHLPVGFGAHHWRVGTPAGTVFATLDLPVPGRVPAAFEDAYAAAADLALQGLDFVLAPLPSVGGTFTVPFGGGSLSCTPWLDGEAVGDGSFAGDDEAAVTAGMLERLHGAVPPPRLPRWQPKIAPGLADELRRLAAEPWTTGPYGEQARAALRSRLADVASWISDYRRLAEGSGRRRWVPTHGEPHTANQVRTSTGLVMVDWESVALAPRERDLGGLVAHGWPLGAVDAEMLALFDLEWRLDEVAQYAAWFAAPHTGSADDGIALEGFLQELTR